MASMRQLLLVSCVNMTNGLERPLPMHLKTSTVHTFQVLAIAFRDVYRILLQGIWGYTAPL